MPTPSRLEAATFPQRTQTYGFDEVKALEIVLVPSQVCLYKGSEGDSTGTRRGLGGDVKTERRESCGGWPWSLE